MKNQISLFSKQLQFFNLDTREALLEAGIGYGKSRVASLWLAVQTQKHLRSNWIMAARDYKQLKTSVDREFEYYLNDIFKIRRGIDYHKINGSPIEYQFKASGSRIFGHSAVNYDTAFRAGNYSGAWGDELDFWKPEAVKALRGRVRVFPEKIRWTSSPYGYNHVYEDFYIKKIGPVINAKTMDNPTLSQEFIDSLRESYDELYYQQEVLAERLNITAGKVYYAFNQEKNVAKTQIDNNPFWVGMDFNPHKMAAVVCQVKGKELHVIDEIFDTSPGSNTEKVCRELISRYGYNMTVVPDSTGNKATSNASRSDHRIIKDMGLRVKTASNPYRVDRYAAVNSALEKELIIIDHKCKNLIKDLERVSYKDNTDKVDDSNPMLSHMSDAFGYVLYRTVNPLQNRSSKIQSYKR